MQSPCFDSTVKVSDNALQVSEYLAPQLRGNDTVSYYSEQCPMNTDEQMAATTNSIVTKIAMNT